MRWVGVGLAVLGLVVIVITHDDYGSRADDAIGVRYGQLTLSYFKSGFQDTAARAFVDTRFRSPVLDLTTTLLEPPSLSGRADLRHLASAFCGLAALLAVFALARAGGSSAAALLAPLALACFPRFYGHAFTNTRDIPFAAAFAWAVYAGLAFLRTGGVRQGIALGIAGGLAASFHAYGLPLLLLVYATALVAGRLRPGDEPPPLGRLLLGSLGWLALAWVVMVAVWPYAHANPLMHPLQAMLEPLAFWNEAAVLVAGEQVPATEVPRSFLFDWLAMTLPLVTLPLAGLGALLATLAVARGRHGLDAPFVAALWAWVLLPVAAVAFLRLDLREGVEHALFVLPALALLIGLGLDLALARLRAPGPLALGLAAAAALLATSVPSMIRLHPYQESYFNAFAGGLRGVAGLYQIDPELQSYRAAADWINERAAERGGPVYVWVAANTYEETAFSNYLDPEVRIRAFFPPNLKDRELLGGLPPGTDYVVAPTRHRWADIFPRAPVVYEIARDGVAFTRIRGREPRGAATMAPAEGLK